MNRRSPVQTIVVAALALLAVVVLNAVGALGAAKSLVGAVVAPVAGTLQLRDGSALARQNRELQTRVTELQAEVAKREEATQTNDALRAQLGFAQTNNVKLTQANIVSQDPTNFRQFFTIDRGSSDGLNKGMVVVSGGAVIGRLTEVTSQTADVFLVTDYNSALPALDQSTRASGVVRGTRGFGLLLEMVPQTEPLKEGDVLLSSGFGGEYPKGLVVGTVGAVTQRDSDVYQTAEVRPAVDFRKLESVFVITGNR